MKFTLTWSDVALRQVAELWLSAVDRAAVTSATDRIDKLLTSDPQLHSAPLREGLHKIIVPPMVALFEIREGDRVVEIACIRLVQLPEV
jgi:plasmid stabilization system protein ParE